MSAPAPLVDQPWTEPGKGAGLLDVVRRRYLLKLLVRKELRVRYRGSVLGLAWSYVKPGVQYVVYFLALGIFLNLRGSIEDYPVYLFSGLVVVNFFTEAFGNATRAVVWNAPLVKKIFLPRELFPVASVWVAGVHFVPQVVVLLIGAVISGWRPQVLPLVGAVLATLIIAALATGLGLLFGSLNVVFRDMENFVDLANMVVVWLSPVLYRWDQVASAVPAWVATVYQLNPITVAVELYHYAFWWPGTVNTPATALPPDLLVNSLVAVVVAAVVLVAGQLVFRRVEGRFAIDL
ncbi:ABC-2 type transport system permease protein [Quadrisphaera granulorum]|uniref:Transport permease protein n=1 Tax=Quadrisphaera granulorum TaxID=317664 RepID=A0A316A643_9ACTN|nr:ABC transporter permease [Quadrisphaera granulorum]PWJ53043.1 ABC-2 type transport system permease protein [Quadrisphaera granulorum]SZE97208.1 ABC-2 type transport system permease protein [Quadrisphaera granulorum]